MKALRRGAGALILLASACLTLRKPEIRFEAVSIGLVSKEGAAVDVDLAVTNPNGYALGVRELTYRLSIAQAAAGDGSISEAVSIPAHATASVKLPLTIAFEPLKSSALEMALMGGIDYAIEGEVIFTTPLGPVRRPFRHEGRLALYR